MEIKAKQSPDENIFRKLSGKSEMVFDYEVRHLKFLDDKDDGSLVSMNQKSYGMGRNYSKQKQSYILIF